MRRRAAAGAGASGTPGRCAERRLELSDLTEHLPVADSEGLSLGDQHQVTAGWEELSVPSEHLFGDSFDAVSMDCLAGHLLQ